MTDTTPELLAGYRRAALMRPTRWGNASAYPTSGTFCSACHGQQFRRDGDGWACSTCHPDTKPDAA